MLNHKFQLRFDELSTHFLSIPKRSSEDFGHYYATNDWKRWATSALGLIRGVFGENSPHYLNFKSEYKSTSDHDFSVEVLYGIFLACKDDFEGGHIYNVEMLVSGEIFGDFIGLAKQALAESHKEVASVLACAALEDA